MIMVISIVPGLREAGRLLTQSIRKEHEKVENPCPLRSLENHIVKLGSCL